MKVIIENFEIYEGKREFEFPEGITVITGSNASGKSSLFYAIQYCLTNPSGVAHIINWNTNEARVTIENNGNSLTWIKTPTSSQYINNNTNEKFIKASKIDASNLADLGFYYDSEGQVINIHDEWSVLFPYGESDTEMFRLFEDIFNISCSFKVIDEISKDEQSCKNSINECEYYISKLTEKIKYNTSLMQKLSKEKAELFLSKLLSTTQQISGLKDDFEKYQDSIKYAAIDMSDNYDITLLRSSYNEMKEDFLNYIKFKQLNDIKLDIRDYQIPQYNKCMEEDYIQYLSQTQELSKYNEIIIELERDIANLQATINSITVCPLCGQEVLDWKI